ncbi:MAG: hypothetical protein AAB316_08420 [Bacteroidota bacterium]
MESQEELPSWQLPRPEDASQPFAQTEARPLDQRSPEDFLLNVNPSKNTLKTLLTEPDLIKTQDGFSKKASLFPPAVFEKNIHSLPASESVKPRTTESPVPLPATKMTEMQAMTGKIDHSLPHHSSNVQPAFGIREAAGAQANGLLNPSTGSRRGSNDNHLEEFRRHFHTEAPKAPVIKVSIGRVEVRAVMQQAPATQSPGAKAAAKPRLTLEDYLKKQNGVHR